jgi:hypothetical protein
MAPPVEPTSTEEDFVGHIERTISLDPAAAWVFIVDRLNTHQDESLVRLVAKQCRLDQDVGVTGKAGILESMSTAGALLYDPTHRSRVCAYPETHVLGESDGSLVRRPGAAAALTDQFHLC